MAITQHALGSGMYGTTSFTALTDKRDVSELLDLWVHKTTPFLNRLTWGPESGGTSLEWISEHLGWGYIETSAAIASNVLSVVAAVAPGGESQYNLARQLQEGTLCYAYSASDGEHALLLIESVTVSTDATIKTITFEFLSTYTTSLAASTKIYILGQVAQEGSTPNADQSRTRDILSNQFVILRKDIKITGSQAATDMYAVPEGELQHQIKLRLLEMQREREMTILYSINGGTVRSSTEASLLQGVLGFLKGQTGSHIDTTTTTLTETAFNNLVAVLAENGANPSVFASGYSQIRKFTAFDRARVRSTPDTKMGGTHITSYLTDVGIEIDLLPLAKVPVNLGFVLDPSKISPRAKKGRKLIVEQLGKVGDYTAYQMISEFSLEFRGYSLGQHGMFSALT